MDSRNLILQSSQNFIWASTNLAVSSTVVAVTMAVPIASYVEAFNHDAELQPDGSWVWSYSFTILEQEYHARLVGRLSLADIAWEMYPAFRGLRMALLEFRARGYLVPRGEDPYRRIIGHEREQGRTRSRGARCEPPLDRMTQ